MEIRRDFYLDKLIKRMHNGLIKVITGVRRCDKYMGLSEYMLYGGIPLVVLRDSSSDKAEALQNLFSDIYIRDICKRNKIRNVGELDSLIFAGILAILMAVVVVQDFCSSMLEKISRL